MRKSWVTTSFFSGLVIGTVVVCAAEIAFLFVRDQNGSPTDKQDSPSAQLDELDRGAGYVSDSELESLLESGRNLERRFESMAPLERTLAIADLLDNFNENGLQKILGLAEEFDSSVLRDELQDVAIRKLTRFNALQTLKHIESLPDERHFSLIKAVFQEWSWEDLDRAVAEAERLGDKLKRAAVEGILTARRDLAAEDRLRLAHELDNEQSFHELAALELAKKHIDDPAGTWEQFIQDYGTNLESLSDSQRAALLHVAKSWVIRDGLRAVEAINSSFPYRESRAWLTQQLLSTLVSADPALARGIVEDLREKDRATLLEVVQFWADEDGLGAFNAAQWMDLGADDTMRMQRAAIEGWARSNPHTLMANLEQLPEYLQEFSRDSALLEMRWTSPESVPAFVEDIGSQKTRDWLLSNLMNSWILYDPSAAFRWALEHEKTSGLQRGYSRSALGAMARSNLEEALSVALEQPLPESGIGAEIMVFGAVGTNAALDMIDLARNPETRLSVLTSLGRRSMRLRDYDGVFSVVEDEPIEVQFDYFKSLAGEMADWSPQTLIDRFDSLPNDDFRRYCSEILLRYNSIKSIPFLSDEQVEKFESFVQEDEEAD